MKKYHWFYAGILTLILLEIAKVYFIMPFPGSQKSNSIGIAYFLDDNLWWIRLLIVVLLVYPLVNVVNSGKTLHRISAIVLILIYGVVYYAFHYQLLAEKMFRQPAATKFSTAVADTNKQKLVLGVSINGKAKAYPVEIIGYHHQVRDTLNGEQLMVTYCTVCRSGRVFNPIVNGHTEKFRLVGMDHFNAMFEDETTKSWWQQATGKSIIGPMKGYQLPEIPSEQMRLGDWLVIHPDSKVMMPDTMFREEYDSLKGYDEGLKRRDTLSWQRKSWVVGVTLSNYSKAYDWTELEKKAFIEDVLDTMPLLLTIEPNKKTHYVMYRKLNDTTFHFEHDVSTGYLRDKETGSFWLNNGFAINGPMKGRHLPRIQSYQEYWHSWKQFQDKTDRFIFKMR